MATSKKVHKRLRFPLIRLGAYLGDVIHNRDKLRYVADDVVDTLDAKGDVRTLDRLVAGKDERIVEAVLILDVSEYNLAI